MLYLGDTHGRLSAVGLDQVIWIIQRPSMPGRNNLNTRLLGQFHDYGISFFRIWIRIPLEDQM